MPKPLALLPRRACLWALLCAAQLACAPAAPKVTATMRIPTPLPDTAAPSTHVIPPQEESPLLEWVYIDPVAGAFAASDKSSRSLLLVLPLMLDELEDILDEEYTPRAFFSPSGRVLEGGETMSVETLLADWKGRMAPPPAAVWLVGPDGVCQAEVGATATIHRGTSVQDRWPVEHSAFLEFAYSLELSGCSGTAWAPVGIVGAGSAVKDLRWHVATQRARYEAGRDAPPRDPLVREYLDAPRGSCPHDRGQMIPLVRALSVETTEPKVLQVAYGAYRQLSATIPDYREDFCYNLQLGLVRDGHVRGVPCAVYQSRGEHSCVDFLRLMGVIAEGNKPSALIGTTGGTLHVLSVAGSRLRLSPEAHVEFALGYHASTHWCPLFGTFGCND